MIPIHELLNRIRWDPEFGKGDFVIGYYDRLEGRILHVSLRELRFDPRNQFAFELMSEDGELHSVPLHRVREVYRDGERIWHREH